MKKIVLLILLASTKLAVADQLIREEWDPKPMLEGNKRVDEIIEWNKLHPGVMPPLTEQEKYELFTKKGIPLPGTGAKAVSNTGMQFTKQQKAFVSNYNNMQKTKGYYEQYSKRAAMLLAMPEIAEKDLEEHKLFALNPNDTHLRETLTDLPMNYSYKGVPRQLAGKIIGYAPEHTFVDRGWNGAVEFFISSFDTICAYHEINIKLTKTSTYIPKEIATYKINNKLTKMNAEGNKDSGFIYEAEWWDNNFKRNLECATKDYSPETTKAIIKLAKQIDKS